MITCTSIDTNNTSTKNTHKNSISIKRTKFPQHPGHLHNPPINIWNTRHLSCSRRSQQSLQCGHLLKSIPFWTGGRSSMIGNMIGSYYNQCSPSLEGRPDWISGNVTEFRISLIKTRIVQNSVGHKPSSPNRWNQMRLDGYNWNYTSSSSHFFKAHGSKKEERQWLLLAGLFEE